MSGPDSPLEGAPLVEARGLVVGYGSRVAAADIDLALLGGEVMALVGVNGSGKSTLLKTIAGLLDPLGGVLEVRGSRAFMAQVQGQGPVLPLQVRDVVGMGRYGRLGLLRRWTGEDRRMVSDAMERTGVAHLARRSYWELSVGQRQRAHLAQALASAADLLILDEPTSGIDAEGLAFYERALEDEKARGGAVVVATHDPGEAERADQVIVLSPSS